MSFHGANWPLYTCSSEYSGKLISNCFSGRNLKVPVLPSSVASFHHPLQASKRISSEFGHIHLPNIGLSDPRLTKIEGEGGAGVEKNCAEQFCIPFSWVKNPVPDYNAPDFASQRVRGVEVIPYYNLCVPPLRLLVR